MTHRTPGPRTVALRSTRRLDGDHGYVIALTSLLIVPMLIFVGLAVDVGAWFAQASKVQRAADAAAMAGVVWLPDTVKAQNAALASARGNGFANGTGGVVVTAQRGTQETDYQVTISTNATRLVTQVFQPSSFRISRSAIARFNKAIPLGSPTNRIGNDVSNATNCPYNQPNNTLASCRTQPMLWSAINGPYQAFAQGDPYSTKCPRNDAEPEDTDTGSAATCDSSTTANGAVNPLYKPGGYSFGIDVSAADLNRPLTVQFYDFGNYPRTTGALNTTKNITRTSYATNSFNLTRSTSGTGTFNEDDIGATVTGPGIPTGTVITAVNTSRTATMSKRPTSNQSSATITLTAPSNVDCPTDQAPFNTYGTSSAQNCQTGDNGDMNMEAQLYDNDGSDLLVSYTAPLAGCRLFVPDESDTFTSAPTYKNKWASLCTFTPTKTGIYPVTVKSSNIAGVTDEGYGNNAFALRVTGGTTTTSTRSYALDDLSIYTNVPQSSAKFYLAEIGREDAGKTLLLDLYDAGDGAGTSDFSMQVKAPPSGAPAAVPTGGTVIPATNIVTSCQYNATASATKGPATPNSSSTCDITTKSGSTAIYNASWLRIKIQISPNYSCTTDCWWTIEYKFGTGGRPTDRTVWSIAVLGDPVHLIE